MARIPGIARSSQDSTGRSTVARYRVTLARFGSLLIADDSAGAIYRVRYRG